MRPIKTLLYTLLISTLVWIPNTYAAIYFHFKHSADPRSAPVPPGSIVSVYIYVKTENGVHTAEVKSKHKDGGFNNDTLWIGEHSESSTKGTIFAPSPNGKYMVYMRCVLVLPNGQSTESIGDQAASMHVDYINVPRNDSVVDIDAQCRVTSENNADGSIGPNFSVYPPHATIQVSTLITADA